MFKWGRRSLVPIVMVAAFLGLSLAGCSSSPKSTTLSQCVFVVGDGSDHGDRSVHHVYTPNKQFDLGTHEIAQYIACGPRNYIINDGSQVNANQAKIGDYYRPTVAWTLATEKEPSVAVVVQSTTNWTPNESTPALLAFYPLCQKYPCYGEDENAFGNANYSSPGWNGMLGENMLPSVNRAIQDAVAQVTYSQIVDNPSGWADLAKKASAQVDTYFRQTTGADQDLICGSGNSVWNSSHTEFFCSQPRMTVQYVTFQNPELQTLYQQAAKNALQAKANKAARDAAVARYGSEASYWLGVKDSIDECASAHTTCVINVGGANGVSVPTPGK